MHLIRALKTPAGQQWFTLLFLITLLLIIPAVPLGKYGGGVAMIVFSSGGMLIYYLLYRERLRKLSPPTIWSIIVTGLLAGTIAMCITLVFR